MTSQCTSDGVYTLTVTFKPGTDLNMAQVRVQNRVNLAMPQLPDVVRATGITTRKRSPELLMTVGITSPPETGYPDGRYDQLHLSNYAVLQLKEELQRLPGHQRRDHLRPARLRHAGVGRPGAARRSAT